jgi:TRAP-type C4-dicarboxylate transport system permease small subunit
MEPTIDDMPHVMGEDGEFHAQDEAVDLSGTAPEAWVALGFFWILGAVVFYQFFTRYVLNDSAAWTEEIARYLLIAVVFTGATIGVMKNNHIQVDFFYRYMPPRMGRRDGDASTCCASPSSPRPWCSPLMMMLKLGSNSRMTMVDLPMNWVYGSLPARLRHDGRALGARRCARTWKRGYSVLERPMTEMHDD